MTSKRCNYCKAPGHVTRECQKYRNYYDQKKVRSGGGRRSRGPSRDNLQKMDGHITAQARALACERAQEELEESRTRLREAEAEVKVLERLVGRLKG